MSQVNPSPLLRRSLRIDAAVSIAAGLTMALLATPLADLTALPAALLAGAGVFATIYAALVALLSRRHVVPRWAVLVVVAGNAAWVLGCVALAFGDWLAPSAAGIAFLLAQAVIVAALAEAQWFGLRRSPGHDLPLQRPQAAAH